MARVNPSTAIITALAALLALPVQAASSGNIYKYVDKDGRTIMSSSVPAEYIRNGYTVLNDKGQVVQVVKPALTAEEVAKLQAAKDAEKKAIADKVAQEENDKLLIRLYRAPEDIVKKRDTAITTMKTQQDLVKLNISKNDEDIKKYQGTIDNNIKAGREAPADAKKKLEQALSSKEKAEAQLKKMDDDRIKLIADAERDFKRLRELMGLPSEAIKAPPELAADKPSAEKPAAK